jgi:hypothetical protein
VQSKCITVSFSTDDPPLSLAMAMRAALWDSCQPNAKPCRGLLAQRPSAHAAHIKGAAKVGLKTRHQLVTKTPVFYGGFWLVETRKSKTGKGICVSYLKIDTVEVCGSSPHGPTILLNNLRTGFRRRRRVCDVVCVVTPLQTPSTEGVEGAALGVEADVGIVSKHLRRDVSGNCHDRLVAGLGLGKLGDGVVSKIMEAQPSERTLQVLNIRAAFLVAAFVGGTL